jgi:ribosomal protein S18 acetylase RimI-like enzyme
MRGARTAWLQVVSDNAEALALYRKMGFAEAYRYAYWRKASR